MTLELTFHGAAGCVTGSCARIRTERACVLVDCGMFQGPKTLKQLNYEPFPFDAASVNAVLLTHAHLDHSGLLPKLVKAGFRGAIHATSGSRALCEIMLADSGHIQESEVERLNRRNERRGRPLVEPIYTVRDAARALRRFETVDYGEWVAVAPGLRARWWNAGHILGSASIEVEADGGEAPVRILFSGDLGSGGRDFLPDPEAPTGLDHVVVESTYGAVERPPIDPAARRRALAKEIEAAHAAGGPLLMPAFAVERTQELLADLVAVIDAGEAPDGEIFLDSPLAIKACEIFLQHGWSGGQNPFERIRATGRLHYLESPAASDRLDRLRGWHIIMAGSGMCDAGRVRKHLKRLLWRREATVLLTGFQATGTLGRLLADGRKTVRIEGDGYRVQARIRSLDLYSGHADGPALTRWVSARQPIAGRVFLVHGEPDSLAGLRGRLVDAGVGDASVTTPAIDDAFTLKAAGCVPLRGAARLAPEAAARLDWHNAKSDFLNRLEERLEHGASDADRLAMLGRLAAALGPPAGAPGGPTP